MFDHVSIEFAQWNNIDAVGADRITVQNSIIANPIGQQFNAHTETVGGSFTWANNIFANAHNRSPLAKINTQFVNNVVYNYQAGYTAGNTGTPFSHDVIGNYFFTGPSTTSSNNDYYQIGNNQKAYVKGNILDANNDGNLNGSADNTADSAKILTSPSSPSTAGLPTLTAVNAFAYDVTHAGANAHGYDQVDSQVIADVNSLGIQGRMWSHQTSTGLTNSGYGVLNDGVHIVDTNNNGIFDAWETAHGLLLSDALGYKKLNPVGYTMLEQYANELTNSAATKTWSANGAAWSTGTNWTGGTPIVYDNAQVRGTGAINGSLVIAQPGANAMTLSIGGNGPVGGESVIVNGGGITIFDTITVGDQNNGSLTLNSGTVTASNIVLGNTVAGNNYTGTLSVNGGLLQVSQIVQGGGTPGNYTVGGKLSVVKSGNGRWFIGVSNNTYSGDTTILGGTLQAWVDNILPSGAGRGNLNLTAGTLQMYGHNQSLNGLNGAGGIDNSSGTRSLTVGNGDGSGNFSGVISGGVNLTKTGTGTQVVLGVNTFVGSAQVIGGTFNLAAGSLSPSSFLNNSTFLHSGGTLTASTVTNTGVYTQTGGTSTIGVLSSPAGTISVGGGISLATMKVTSFNVATMVVANNANVSVPTSAIVATQFASSLGISGNGTLDLANNELVVAATSAANIGTYVSNAYRLNHSIPNVGDWTGSGITSSLAVARPYVFSVGFADGNTPSGQNSGIKINGVPIAAGQVLVRPTLVGDINLDGKVDHNDLNQLLSYRYNTGSAANYTDGDLNYSGTVGPEDINVLLSAHYEVGNSFVSPGAVPGASASTAKAAAKLTTTSLTGSARSVTPATTTTGVLGDGQPDYVYNPLTGDVKFVLDGFVPVTMAAAPSFIASIQFASATGKIIFANDNVAIGNSAGSIENANLVYGALTKAPGFVDGFDLGRILPIGLTNAQLINDLTVNYTVLNGGPTGTSDIVVATPEPTAMAIFGAGMAGLLGRRRRRNLKRVV